MLVQRNGSAVHFSVFQRDDPVERMMIVTDAAGVQKQRFSAHIHERTVGVAKQEQIQILFFRRIACAHHGLFHTVSVSVADQNPFILWNQKKA